jgi:peptide/nickel transport system permease protein
LAIYAKNWKKIPTAACSFWVSLTMTGKIGLAILVLTAVMALLAPYLAVHSPFTASGETLQPPGNGHLLGTDNMGVDIWAQLCYGARISLYLGFATALLAGFGGSIIGIAAGYWGGKVDRVILSFIDIMLVLPRLPMIIFTAAFFGSSLENIIIVLVAFNWMGPARLVRSQVLSLREQDYILAAKSYGAKFWYMLRKHLIPELAPIIMVSMVRLASRGIVAEAGLAFLGLGDPSSKSWGMMIYYATNFRGIYFTPFWQWWLLYPWLAITILVVGFALVGRDMERSTDPRLRYLVSK